MTKLCLLPCFLKSLDAPGTFIYLTPYPRLVWNSRYEAYPWLNRLLAGHQGLSHAVIIIVFESDLGFRHVDAKGWGRETEHSHTHVIPSFTHCITGWISFNHNLVPNNPLLHLNFGEKKFSTEIYHMNKQE